MGNSRNPTHSTEGVRPPKRPVVSTLTSALVEVERWLEDSRLREIRDGDGLVWMLAVEVDQIPDPADPKGLVWRLKLKLSADATATDLVRTGALDAKTDQRLIELLDDEPVHLAMKPLIYTAPNEEAARLLLTDVVPRLKASFPRDALGDIKRQLVGRQIDERSRFGGSLG